ncbi:MAG: hypothetical protein ABI668_16125, partial [Sphingorhabdus sp.]
MTHPRIHATRKPSHPAIIMSDSGETLSYGALEAQANFAWSPSRTCGDDDAQRQLSPQPRQPRVDDRFCVADDPVDQFLHRR